MNKYYDKLNSLSDDKLLDMIRNQRDQFKKIALDSAAEILEERGVQLPSIQDVDKEQIKESIEEDLISRIERGVPFELLKDQIQSEDMGGSLLEELSETAELNEEDVSSWKRYRKTIQIIAGVVFILLSFVRIAQYGYSQYSIYLFRALISLIIGISLLVNGIRIKKYSKKD